jgi:hypothetical protein
MNTLPTADLAHTLIALAAILLCAHETGSLFVRFRQPPGDWRSGRRPAARRHGTRVAFVAGTTIPFVAGLGISQMIDQRSLWGPNGNTT